MTSARLAPGGGTATAVRRRRRTGWGQRTQRPARKTRLLSTGSTWTMRLGLWLGLAVYGLFGIVPALANVIVSLTNYSGLAGSTTSFSGLSNYRAMLTTERPGFISALWITVVFVVGVTVVQNGFGLMLAHRLQGGRRIDSVLRVLVFVPIVLGVTVVGLIWILIFDPAQGPAASLLKAFGTSSAFFGATGVALPLVIGVQIWQNLGFTTLVYIGGLKSISREIYEAASLDGAGRWARLRRITLPLLAPAMTINILLAVIGSFTTYNLIYILTDGQYSTQTLGMLAFNNAFGLSANLGYGAAVSVALFVLTLIVALPLQWYLRRREWRITS
ncbi:MAG TPA: sugar ABC transporter permease [Streptosporangiaceae bacterium]|nr:sugar ABC transporter permease [Streptosporangiaceae bacterium]